MSSQSQIEANRANAQLSTGPRSPEGKAASSQNARTHGLTAKDMVILPHEQDDFLDLQIDLTAQIKPIGALELTAFDNLLHAAWNMRRIRRLEAQLAESGSDPLSDPNLAAQCDRYARYFGRAEKSYYRALRELRTLQADRYVLENANHLNLENISPLVPIAQRAAAPFCASSSKAEMAKRSQLATNATIDCSVTQFELNSQRRQNEPSVSLAA